MKQNIKYKDIDYVAYNLYVNYKPIKDRLIILPIKMFIDYHKGIVEDDIKLSIYYENAKNELRKRKLKKLNEKS